MFYESRIFPQLDQNGEQTFDGIYNDAMLCRCASTCIRLGPWTNSLFDQGNLLNETLHVMRWMPRWDELDHWHQNIYSSSVLACREKKTGISNHLLPVWNRNICCYYLFEYYFLASEWRVVCCCCTGWFTSIVKIVLLDFVLVVYSSRA